MTKAMVKVTEKETNTSNPTSTSPTYKMKSKATKEIVASKKSKKVKSNLKSTNKGKIIY